LLGLTAGGWGRVSTGEVTFAFWYLFFHFLLKLTVYGSIERPVGSRTGILCCRARKGLPKYDLKRTPTLCQVGVRTGIFYAAEPEKAEPLLFGQVGVRTGTFNAAEPEKACQNMI
jgi:hypothetical protein